MAVLVLKDVSYRYEGTKKLVLNKISVSFERGKVYAIVGRSGAGKSTLLFLMAGLDVCAHGEILYSDASLKTLDRDAYRAKSVGVVFQSLNLLTNVTAVENIVLSMNISGSRERDKRAFAYALLQKVGIDRETADRRILKLSGGEQQRVAIARALSHRPDVIIADEPTGNLDWDNAAGVLKILTSLARNDGKCVIVVTHSRRVASAADEIWGIKDGKLMPVSRRDLG